ncbi:MAG: trypsin-like peptidase domain-containing protein [Clostridia bacterium]|nr:trypsin-like peptidase domain-containing protein [Clostridia bacterium]
MKNKTIFKIFSVICLIFASLVVFSSCSLLSGGNASIVNAAINTKGELILEYSNGYKQNLGVVVGQDGEDGKDGLNGKDGINGVDGKDGKDGKDGIDGKDGKDGEVVIEDGTVILSDSIEKAVSECIQSTVVIQCGFDSKSTSAAEIDSYSTGSGVIYSFDAENGDAFIITNYHVVYSNNSSTDNGISDSIDVFLYGHLSEDQAIPATYVGGSMNYDLALLQITDSELIRNSEIKAVDIRSSDDVHVGETVFAIGNPQATGFSVTSGIISVDSETIEMTGADEKTKVNIRVMRTDTPINSGNSGGGLFDEDGKLIGIVNAKYIDTSIDNIGYAIPSRTVVTVIENLMYYCLDTDVQSVQRPLLGITVQIMNPYAKYNKETGLVDLYENSTVVTVNEGGLADGKLLVGDILRKIEITGQKNYSVDVTRQYFIEVLINARVGDIVTVTVERDGELIPEQIIITKECMIES